MVPEINYEIKPLTDKNKKSIHISIDEKVQTIVSSIRLLGLTAASEDTALKSIGLKKGKPFRNYMLKSDENAISAIISEKGIHFKKRN